MNHRKHLILFFIALLYINAITQSSDTTTMLNDQYQIHNFDHNLQESIQYWKEFLQENPWPDLIENINPADTGCGWVYALPYHTPYGEETFAIADMRDMVISQPHFHKETTEIYIILEGHVNVIVGDAEYECNVGDVIIIPPYFIHYVLSNRQCILAVISIPGFILSDYYPLEDSGK